MVVESLCSSSRVDAELADGVGDDGEGERGDVGVEEAVEAAADAIVVERGELRRRTGRAVGGRAVRPTRRRRRGARGRSGGS